MATQVILLFFLYTAAGVAPPLNLAVVNDIESHNSDRNNDAKNWVFTFYFFITIISKFKFKIQNKNPLHPKQFQVRFRIRNTLCCEFENPFETFFRTPTYGCAARFAN